MPKEIKIKKIITGIISSVALVGGGTTAGILSSNEAEAKEEENEEEKKAKPTGSVKKAPNTKPVDKKIELATVLPRNQRNLGTIATNGALQPTVAQIQTELSKKSIDTSQVDITVNSSTQATVSAKANSNY